MNLLGRLPEFAVPVMIILYDRGFGGYHIAQPRMFFVLKIELQITRPALGRLSKRRYET